MIYRFFIFLSIIFIALSCSKKPEAIRYGSDNCAYCKMMITDQRYGSEVVSQTGKNYKFDSIECMAAYILTKKIPSEQIYSLWVTNFGVPKQLIKAKPAVYLRSKDLHSPMGLNLSAFKSKELAEKVQRLYTGELMSWDDVLSYVKIQWIDK